MLVLCVSVRALGDVCIYLCVYVERCSLGDGLFAACDAKRMSCATRHFALNAVCPVCSHCFVCTTSISLTAGKAKVEAPATAASPSPATPRPWVRVAVLCAMGAMTVASAGVTASALAASYHNYPGFRALVAVHSHADDRGPFTGRGGAAHPLRVHICVAAAETGVSRCGERASGWSYSKDEALTADATKTSPEAFDGFDYVVTDAPGFHEQRFQLVEAVHGFDRIDWRGVAIVTKPVLYVLAHKP